MNTRSLAFDNDDERRRAVAWVVALASTFPVAAPPPPANDAGRPEGSAGPTDTRVYQVLYRSTATRLFTSQEVLGLFEIARRLGQKHQLTGLLLYSEGHFVQAIEGPEALVRAVFSRIQQDPWHHRVETMSEGYLPDRRFSEWHLDFGYSIRSAAGPAAHNSPILPPLPGLSTTSAHLKRLLEACIG